MPSKKELQEQIDSLRRDVKDLYEQKRNIRQELYLKFSKEKLFIKVIDNDFRLLENVNISNFGVNDYGCVNIIELRKQFLALLDYLKLEYKVEDKHTEGFKKK